MTSCAPLSQPHARHATCMYMCICVCIYTRIHISLYDSCKCIYACIHVSVYDVDMYVCQLCLYCNDPLLGSMRPAILAALKEERQVLCSSTARLTSVEQRCLSRICR
eukprot:GHVQ01032774.1.p1 GENE.GHVQ01032774.1~~GHVQ01032774.1.p1  ORF type:complete len:107 (-),score=9.18 GHVQ01032774.1:56-376(-)